MSYVGTPFHKILPNVLIQGGDYINHDGSASESIFGGHFEDENFKVRHAAGALAMASGKDKHSNGSQFYITMGVTTWYDDKNVVFGRVESGFNIVRQLTAHGTRYGKPTK